MIEYLLCCLVIGAVGMIHVLEFGVPSIGTDLALKIIDKRQETPEGRQELVNAAMGVGVSRFGALSAILLWGAVLYVVLRVIAFFLGLLPSIEGLLGAVLAS